MDISTLLGFIVGLGVLWNVAENGRASVLDVQSLLIVVGGGIAWTLISARSQDVIRIFSVLRNIFRSRKHSPEELVDRIVGYAETARREGILALEASARTEIPYVATGIRLSVDGTEPELVQAIMGAELDFVEDRHRQQQKLVQTFGINWMIFGVIGAISALITGATEATPDRLALVGLPLAYGLLLAGLFAISIKRKLEIRSEEEVLYLRMTMEGIMSIQSGDNPRIVAQKLDILMAPRSRGGWREHDAERRATRQAERRAAEPQPDEEMVTRISHAMGRLQAALPEQVRSANQPLKLPDLLEILPDDARLEIVESLGEGSKEAPAASPWTYVFDDIVNLADREIQLLLREIDTRELACALIGAGQALRDRFYANVSERVGGLVKDEMVRRKDLDATDILAAQLKIVDVLRQLQGAGQISIGR